MGVEREDVERRGATVEPEEADRLARRRHAGRRVARPVAIILIIAGLICVALGIAGIFLPLLPTTPFLLLAGACFMRSSERFYRWLISNRWFGGYIRAYMEHRATTVGLKIASMSMLWCFLTAAAVFFTDSWIVRALLLVIAVGVTVHLASLKTAGRGAAASFSRSSARDVTAARRVEKEAR